MKQIFTAVLCTVCVLACDDDDDNTAVDASVMLDAAVQNQQDASSNVVADAGDSSDAAIEPSGDAGIDIDSSIELDSSVPSDATFELDSEIVEVDAAFQDAAVIPETPDASVSYEVTYGTSACKNAMSDFDACGGVLAGKWHLSEKCEDFSMGESCELIAAVNQNYDTYSDVLNFESREVTRTISLSGTVSQTYNLTCYGSDYTCSQAIANPGQTCAGTASACVCSWGLSENSSHVGTYTSYDTGELNITWSDLTTSGFDYCVSGNKLLLLADTGDEVLIFVRE